MRKDYYNRVAHAALLPYEGKKLQGKTFRDLMETFGDLLQNAEDAGAEKFTQHLLVQYKEGKADA